MAEKHWIQSAIKHPGALHTELHVPQGQTIPVSKIKTAETKGGKEGARARLAMALRGMHK